MVKNLGQMKIQQTAFMLIALTLFFALVGLFIAGFKFSDLKRGASDLEENNAMLLVTKLANSPEFSCGEAFGSKRDNCVDADKVMILKDEISSKYRGFWGVADIKIRKIYPADNSACTAISYPECGVINLISNSTIGTYDSTFVALCRKEAQNNDYYDKCELARLMVSYQNKQ